MTPQLNFIGLHSERIGYGVHYLATLQALREIDIDTYDGLPGSGDEALDKKRTKVCRDVLFLSIPTHIKGWHEGQRAHLFTMWETNRLPEAMREVLHHFETLIVPSEENAALYRQYHDNVHVVPLGIDSQRWQYQERRTDETFFNFLTLGSGARKGIDLVHKAFLELFGDGPPANGPIPRLFIKSPNGEPYSGNGVKVIQGFMPPEDLVDLYASAHCYVGASRGEGWGMQPMQAIAQGCPTILTNAHGHAPFAEYGISVSATPMPAEYMRMWGESGEWWEPDFDELTQAMWDVYSNYEAHRERARVASAELIERFTWERSAELIVDALGGRPTLSERFRSDALPGEWHDLTPKRFHVKTTRNWRADIGGVVYAFEKGRDYVESADVKRVLFEANVLDPSCVSDGDGLTEEQAERLTVTTAAKSRCGECGQVVPDEADDA